MWKMAVARYHEKFAYFWLIYVTTIGIKTEVGNVG